MRSLTVVDCHVAAVYNAFQMCLCVYRCRKVNYLNAKGLIKDPNTIIATAASGQQVCCCIDSLWAYASRQWMTLTFSKKTIVFDSCFLLSHHVNSQLITVQVMFPIIVFDYLSYQWLAKVKVNFTEWFVNH